ncbi:hypothetical protein, partial [Devosia indica]
LKHLDSKENLQAMVEAMRDGTFPDRSTLQNCSESCFLSPTNHTHGTHPNQPPKTKLPPPPFCFKTPSKKKENRACVFVEGKIFWMKRCSIDKGTGGRI